MKQEIELNKLDLVLRELDDKIEELNLQLLDIVSNIKYGIALSEEKKKKGLEVASFSANAMIELQKMRQSGQVNEKTTGYMQAGAAIVGIGALLYTGLSHFKERSQIIDYLKQVKEMENQQSQLIQLNYDKMSLLIDELQDTIQNKIIKIIDYLSKFTLVEDKSIDVLQKLHGFVVRYIDFVQKYHVFNAYKDHFTLYMQRDIFSLDLPIEKANETKVAFINDIVGIFKRINTGTDTVGMQYMVLNYDLFLSNKEFKDELKVIKNKGIKEIAKIVNMTKRLSNITKTPLNKAFTAKIKEIQLIGSEQSATKEKVEKAIGHLLESYKQNRKKANNDTEQLLLEYIGKKIYKDKEINKAGITEFDMRILSELVKWYEGASRIGRKTAIGISIIYVIAVAYFLPWLIIFTPLVYWSIKKFTSKDILYTEDDKRRLESQFGKDTIFNFWMIDRLGKNDKVNKAIDGFIKIFK